MNGNMVIAIDPRKASNTAVVLDPVTTTVIETARFANSVAFIMRLAARRAPPVPHAVRRTGRWPGAPVPYHIRREPSGEMVLLDQVIASVRSQLGRFAGDDPAALPLREHLDELTARRNLLLRAEEDSAYAWSRGAIWVGLFLAAGGMAMAAGGLAGLVGTGPGPLAVHVVLMAGGAFLMLVGFPLTVGTWSDIREYRRTHPAEPS